MPALFHGVMLRAMSAGKEQVALQGKEHKQEMGNYHKGTFLDNLMPRGSNTLDRTSKDLEVSALSSY